MKMMKHQRCRRITAMENVSDLKEKNITMADKKKYKRPKLEDVRVGGKIGRLLLLKEIRMPHGNRTDAGYLCKCDCGNEKQILRSNLLSGAVVSCGCFQKDIVRKTNKKHGKAGDKVYNTWAEMKSRCFDKGHISYDRYGGRGITVCDRWKNSFEAFYADMGDPPGKDYSIDRIDNNGNYELGNCRWATTTQQARNKRNCVIVEYDGEKMCVTELAEKLGKNAALIRDRIKRGWDLNAAINTPSDTRNNKKWFIERQSKEYYGG